MNKYNLYNLSRLDKPNTTSRTYFQQKWTAKATSRAYHGEQMREKQWQRLFSRTTAAVVPMNPDYLARHDGSEQAAGRGSGLEVPPEDARRSGNRMPYMQMVYHPTERRLDTAIFRALFASSARQARQFVTHGQVKVNGKKVGVSRQSLLAAGLRHDADDAVDALPWLHAQPGRHVPSRARARHVRLGRLQRQHFLLGHRRRRRHRRHQRR